ncbi:MAG: magnesium transporter [Thermodesulfobacteriota bacterium]
MATQALESLVRSFVSHHPEDAARSLESIAPSEAGTVLSRLPSRAVGAVLERLAPVPAGAILEAIGPEAARELLGHVEARHAAAILHHVDEGLRTAALSALPEHRARQIESLLQYPGDTAGGMMDPHVTSIPIDLSVRDAIAAIRRAPRQTLYYLYVTDRDGRLAGVLNMRELLLAAPRDPIAELVHRTVVTVPATMDREELAALMRDRRFIALPVVDADGRLLGIVKHDEVLEAVQQEAFGDLQKLSGAGEDERALSPVPVVVRKRLPWLLVNLGTAFLASAVIGVFEGVIERVTALAVLLPIVAGQGGNTGAQSLAVVIRGIALRELGPGTSRRVMTKETIAALLNGLAVAVVTGIGVFLWDGRAGLVAVIALAMVVNMAVAGFAGAGIPLMLRMLGRDPAQSASIFLTTVTDIVGFGAFLGFAVLLMRYIA